LRRINTVQNSCIKKPINTIDNFLENKAVKAVQITCPLYFFVDIGVSRVAFGLKKVNSAWTWSRGNYFYNAQVNWYQTPTTAGDCAAFAKNNVEAVTFNCSEPQKYICQS